MLRWIIIRAIDNIITLESLVKEMGLTPVVKN